MCVASAATVTMDDVISPFRHILQEEGEGHEGVNVSSTPAVSAPYTYRGFELGAARRRPAPASCPCNTPSSLRSCLLLSRRKSRYSSEFVLLDVFLSVTLIR
jgi:hypothetical protein